MREGSDRAYELSAMTPEPTEQEWDDYEEDGPLDLEEQLDRALERAFPLNQVPNHD